MTGSPSSGHSVGREKIPWSYGKSLRSSGLSQSSFVYLDCGGRTACTACTACTASVEEDDKTVEEWETEDDKGGLGCRGCRGRGHTETKCMHLWVMEIACRLPNVSISHAILGKPHVMIRSIMVDDWFLFLVSGFWYEGGRKGVVMLIDKPHGYLLALLGWKRKKKMQMKEGMKIDIVWFVIK